MTDPLAKPKQDFNELIAQIGSADSPVGIDAKYMHARDHRLLASHFDEAGAQRKTTDRRCVRVIRKRRQ